MHFCACKDGLEMHEMGALPHLLPAVPLLLMAGLCGLCHHTKNSSLPPGDREEERKDFPREQKHFRAHCQGEINILGSPPKNLLRVRSPLINYPPPHSHMNK